MSKIELSVIIPIYNAEEYLEECLDSILKQTCMPEKIILVDDGSTDRSSEICDRYSREYANILVIHQRNQGVATSRKNGIRHVETRYVTFIDADDWIDADFFEQMLVNTLSEDVDIVITGFVHEYGNYQRTVAAGLPEGIYSREEFHRQFLSGYIYDFQKQKYGIISSLWAKIYHTKLLEEDLCEVDPRLTLGEDGVVVYPLLAKAAKISISAYCGYHYRRHEAARMANIDTMDFQQVEMLQKCLYRKFEKIGLLEKVQQQIDRFCLARLEYLTSKIYGIEICEAGIIFPHFEIPVNSRIVVYGAGKVGMAYMRELLPSKQYSVVLWADQKRTDCCYGHKIVKPQEIIGADYDLVLIAIADEYTSEKVKSDLINMGVLPEKISWFPVQWRP